MCNYKIVKIVTVRNLTKKEEQLVKDVLTDIISRHIAKEGKG